MIGAKVNNNFEINRNQISQVSQILNKPINYNNHKFVGGTIFWVRNDIFRKYFTDDIIDKILQISPEGYVHEPSINHAMERIFGSLVYMENQELVVL